MSKSNKRPGGTVEKKPKFEPLPEKVTVHVNVFTYNGSVGGDAFIYTHAVSNALRDHPRVAEVFVSYSHGYPTDRCRNEVLMESVRKNHDFVLMLDDDMAPDIGLRPDMRDAEAVPFMPAALDFALEHEGPCVVAAPYCSSPPEQNVVVMKNRVVYPDQPPAMGTKLDKYTRDEAADQTGIKEVAALPTGVMLIDARVTKVLPTPWFYYEYTDPHNTRLASTEDVVFSRNLSWLGVPQYCAWSSWAGHQKRYLTGKPVLSPVVQVPQAIWKSLRNGNVPVWADEGLSVNIGTKPN